MSRPTKQTLDFVQLDTNDKTTLKRLYRKFGRDGRLFWYELLRLLGRSKGYYLDLSDEWILEDVLEEELFIGKTAGISIIEALVLWGLLDENLWQKHKIIWCQSLIDRHELLFKKRNKIPEKPTSTVVSVSEIEVSGAETIVSDAISTQKKVKGNKEKDIANAISKKKAVGGELKTDEVSKAAEQQQEINKKAVRFTKQLEDPKEQLWRDTFYMQQGLRKGSLGRLLQEFNKHLVLQPPDNPNYDYREYKTHFTHWVNKQNQMKKIEKYKL